MGIFRKPKGSVTVSLSRPCGGRVCPSQVVVGSDRSPVVDISEEFEFRAPMSTTPSKSCGLGAYSLTFRAVSQHLFWSALFFGGSCQRHGVAASVLSLLHIPLRGFSAPALKPQVHRRIPGQLLDRGRQYARAPLSSFCRMCIQKPKSYRVLVRFYVLSDIMSAQRCIRRGVASCSIVVAALWGAYLVQHC